MAYYISPRFLEKLAVHITKNYLKLPDVKVPLIMGVHGRKGEGKTFQCELVYERMGIEVVHISGGELESPDAGDPARLIRLRYREAAELVKVRGRMAVLMINDIDAGAGRFDATTQYTVNTQLVNNTLMNIADNPTNVQLPGSYDDQPLQRVPIILTGNDLSTLYAPLIRDGRMDKFYWEPDRDDRIGIVGGIFEPDGLGSQAIKELVDRYSRQAIDFFGALRAQIYNEQIRDFVYQVGLENVSMRVVNTETPPTFPKPDFSLDHLFGVGDRMVAEQRRVEEMRLAQEYNQAFRREHLNTLDRDSADHGMEIYRAYGDRANGHGANQENGSEAKPAPSPQARETALASETVQQIRQLLDQGYRVGMEHVDQRRFRTNAWKSCSVLHTDDPSEAAQAMEQCLMDYPDEYVRMIGIDPASKQRVLEQIVQRPQ
ncbi:ribulose 1,5-bisphosphate carboxylase [filamentous cyanobacterium CCP5]|nr:ribulose 1,5-bisphosphate carboxylase [filamentous cyanobacterium CCP5]